MKKKSLKSEGKPRETRKQINIQPALVIVSHRFAIEPASLG